MHVWYEVKVIDWVLGDSLFNFTGIIGVVCCPKNLKWLL